MEVYKYYRVFFGFYFILQGIYFVEVFLFLLIKIVYFNKYYDQFFVYLIIWCYEDLRQLVGIFSFNLVVLFWGFLVEVLFI